MISWSRKDHVTRDNLSLQLAMQFLPKKILQVAVRMSDVRNLFATCNEIIFQARRVFKNVSGIQIMSYCDWSKNCETICSGGLTRCNLSRSIAKSRSCFYFCLQLGTQFFVGRLVANMGCHMRTSSLQLAMQCNAIAWQVARKIAACNMVLTCVQNIQHTKSITPCIHNYQ